MLEMDKKRVSVQMRQDWLQNKRSAIQLHSQDSRQNKNFHKNNILCKARLRVWNDGTETCGKRVSVAL